MSLFDVIRAGKVDIRKLDGNVPDAVIERWADRIQAHCIEIAVDILRAAPEEVLAKIPADLLGITRGDNLPEQYAYALTEMNGTILYAMSNDDEEECFNNLLLTLHNAAMVIKYRRLGVSMYSAMVRRAIKCHNNTPHTMGNRYNETRDMFKEWLMEELLKYDGES